MSRVLGVDYGTRRVGLAISDAGRKIASPLTTLARGSAAEETHLRRLLQEENVSLIVVGLPVRERDYEGQKAQEARRYGQWLHQLTGLPVVFWSERYTTDEAERLLQQAGLSKKRRQARLDKVAAQLILQSYLDAGCPDAPGDPSHPIRHR